MAGTDSVEPEREHVAESVEQHCHPCGEMTMGADVWMAVPVGEMMR